jgi:hypothetical protein
MVGLLGKRQPAARQVGDNRLPDARHVVGKRRTERRRQEIDRPIGKALAQHLHHRMAADEVADPHIRHDQDRTRVLRASRRAARGPQLVRIDVHHKYEL